MNHVFKLRDKITQQHSFTENQSVQINYINYLSLFFCDKSSEDSWQNLAILTEQQLSNIHSPRIQIFLQAQAGDKAW